MIVFLKTVVMLHEVMIWESEGNILLQKHVSFILVSVSLNIETILFTQSLFLPLNAELNLSILILDETVWYYNCLFLFLVLVFIFFILCATFHAPACSSTFCLAKPYVAGIDCYVDFTICQRHVQMLCSACMSFWELNIYITFPIALPGIISLSLSFLLNKWLSYLIFSYLCNTYKVTRPMIIIKITIYR